MDETTLKATTALEEINRWNRKKKYLDAYLHEIANWGLGLRQFAPNPDDYGLDPIIPPILTERG